MSRHVAVLMGGWSAEREVSLVSGAAAGEALRARGYRVSEIDVGVAEIVAEYTFAEVLEEELPGRRLSIELAALMPRAGEGDVGFRIVCHEPAEEWRQQRCPVPKP